MNAAWSELREFIRRLNLIEDDQRRMKLDIQAIQQGIYLASSLRSEIKTYNCTFSGQAQGCGFRPFPNASVIVRNASTGAVLAAVQADGSGNFNGQCNLSTSPTSITVTVSPSPSDPFFSRFAAASPIAGYSLSYGSNSLGNFSGPGPASGYHCALLGTPLYYPLPSTLYIRDSAYGGPYAITWNGTNWSTPAPIAIGPTVCGNDQVTYQWGGGPVEPVVSNSGTGSCSEANIPAGQSVTTGNPLLSTTTWIGGTHTLDCGSHLPQGFDGYGCGGNVTITVQET